ncbi:MAG: glycosyltransferase [Alphaproteobacteria bacterium]|nr:glycosyltransferase [Alphaproteobacteria bacterium]
MPVTVVIPTRNEERNLPACLSRLGAFAHVWIVDSGSSDATCDIARERSIRVIDFRWAGGFPKKRNWTLMNEQFPTDWVLFLDADEHVTDTFVDEARTALARPDMAGFWLNYTTHFMGEILAHGVPQRKLALFRVGAGLYERIEDTGWSDLDMEVHEHPVLDGPVGEIRAPIDHLDFRGLDHFVARHESYARWEASRYLELAAGGDARWRGLTRRQKIKYASLTRAWFAPAYFAMTYFLKRGFLDGTAGLHYAVFKMEYFRDIRRRILASRGAERNEQRSAGRLRPPSEPARSGRG